MYYLYLLITYMYMYYKTMDITLPNHSGRFNMYMYYKTMDITLPNHSGLFNMYMYYSALCTCMYKLLYLIVSSSS